MELDLNNYDQDEAYRVLQNIYYQSRDKGGIDNSIRFSELTEKQLMSHQPMHVFNMISALNDNKNNAILDGSYTGTGKTYTTAAICRETKRRPFVICLKSNINTWKRVLGLFEVKPIAIVNYELIRTGQYLDENGDTVECPYLVRDKNRFKWDFTKIGKKNIVMVFDEVHVCKNKSSLNSKLLTSSKSLKVIMLSATLCDKIEDFGVFGMMLGFYSSIQAGKNWLDNIIRQEKRKLDNRKEDVKMNLLHKEIFNTKGSRMSLDDLGNDMSRDNVSIECYSVDKKVQEKIDALYDDIRKQKRKAEDCEDQESEIAKDRQASALRAIGFKREKIENIKADILMELAESSHESRMSVVIFVNYRSTHQIICDKLKRASIDYAIIIGDQSISERDDQIQMFQRNEVRMMVAMAQAGGSSISLHDTTGKFPRVSIISPSYSVIELVQILGRIKRSGTKSSTTQKIVYCANTCEEHLAQKVKEKEEIISLMTGEKSTKIIGNSETSITNGHRSNNDNPDVNGKSKFNARNNSNFRNNRESKIIKEFKSPSNTNLMTHMSNIADKLETIRPTNTKVNTKVNTNFDNKTNERITAESNSKDDNEIDQPRKQIRARITRRQIL